MNSPPDMPIRVDVSTVHGRGVFATRALAAGEQIGVYAGLRFKRGRFPRVARDQEFTYVFSLSDGGAVDGSKQGNATAHLNHSCVPNCIAREEMGTDGLLQIVFFTLRRIQCGSELFIDYALQVEANDDGVYKCRCASPRCRGTMTEVVTPCARTRRSKVQ